LKDLGEIVLGEYTYKEGGSIRLYMGANMEYESSINTQIHEMNHMHLDNVTTLGNVLEILEMERVCTPEADKSHINKIKKYEDIIRNRTASVQEIYANCIELLLIDKLGGAEESKRCYDSKTKEYKNYCDCLKCILNDKKITNHEKHQIINAICFYAMGIDISIDSLIKIIENDELVHFLNDINNPDNRLKKALEKYNNGEIEQIIDVVKNQDLYDLIIKLIKSNEIKYIDDFSEEIQEFIKNIKKGNIGLEIIDSCTDNYQKNIEEHIKVFDLNHLHVFKNDDAFRKINLGIFAIKQCKNIIEDKNYYIIGHENIDSKPYYISKEVDETELKEIINKVECVCISNYEYDTKNLKPLFVDFCNKPKFIVFDSYQECYKWVNEEVKGKDYYIGNLYDKSVNNFFTVLFFVNRNKSDDIYVFPTTKILAERIIDKSEFGEEVIYSKEYDFLKIFACFDDQIKIMQSIQWLLTFFVDSKGDYDVENDSAAKLSYDFIRTLLNKSFDLTTRIDQYKYNFKLPTKRTVGNPFYAIMRFEGKKNSGNIFTPSGEYVLFFPNKDLAEYWKSKKCNKKYNKYIDIVVGIDYIYWSAIREILIKKGVKILIHKPYIMKGNSLPVYTYDASYVDKMIRNFKK